MKVSLLVVLVCGVAAADHGNANCCPRTYMEWSAESCRPFRRQSYYNGQYGEETRPIRCYAKVCNDGRIHDGWYCGKGKCNSRGCNCDGGCIEGDPVANFRRINNIPDAKGGWFDATTSALRAKRSNPIRSSGAGGKIIKAAIKGYKEGQLSADQARKDAERARKNAVTVPPNKPNYAKQAWNQNKRPW